MALPTDVLYKIIQNNSIRNGDSVTGALVTGDYEVVRAVKNKAPVLDAVNNKLKNKFTGNDSYST